MAKDVDDLVKVPDSVLGYLKQMKNSVDSLKWIWTELTTQEGRGYFFRMVAYISIQILLSMAPVAIVPMWLDAMGARDLTRSLWLMGAIAVTIFVGQVFSRANRRSWERAFGELRTQMPVALTRKFLSKGIGQYRQEGSYLSASNVEKARGRVWGITENLTFGGIAAVLEISVAYIGVWWFYPAAGAIVSIMFAVYLISSVYLNKQILEKCKPLEGLFNKHDRYRNDVWDLAERVINSAKIEDEIRHMREWMEDIMSADRRIWFWHIDVTSARGAVLGMIFILEMVFVTHNVVGGNLHFTLAVPVFFWSFGLFNNIWRLGFVERVISWSIPAVQVMIETLESPTNVPVRENPVKVNSAGPLSVEFKNVSFAYPADDGKDPQMVLKDISFSFQGGEKIGLVGLSGSGKSTIGYLLMRFMDPTSGEILLNGVNLRDLELDQYRQVTGHIAQEPQIFDRSVRENVLYQVPSNELDKLTDEQIWKVLESVELENGSRFSQGLDTRIGRNGMKLSGGQRQRLMIAAAIIQNLRLIVIDEATSSLDAETELKVQMSIEKMLGMDTTAFVIAHRLCTLRFCDKIVILRPLEGLEDGEQQIEYIATSFADALANSPTFKKFADIQRRLIEF